ncbi:MAG: hypothetical protein ACREFZ_00875 [Acetobacteraceae bacterium]
MPPGIAIAAAVLLPGEMRIGTAELHELAGLMRRLAPSRIDPECFHIGKSEAVSRWRGSRMR